MIIDSFIQEWTQASDLNKTTYMNNTSGGILDLNTPDFAADNATVVLFGDDMGESESATTLR